MKIRIQILFILFPIIVIGQDTKLSMFQNIVGKTWKAEGSWGDGSKFYQETYFHYDLDSLIVLAESTGFVDLNQTKLGKRNHGIRQYDAISEEILFWEFDIFGGLTKGSVFQDGKNIIYQYKYGDSKVTDMWEYVNDTTYNFKVGEYKNGNWSQIYLTSQFKQTNNLSVNEIFSIAKENLNGSWSSPAWDGQLNESWSLDKNGHLTQSSRYIENQEILFESQNKMEIVDNELILFSIIKGSNPKIFKATSWTSNSITFENSDYNNPNKVKYHFISPSEFKRTISGIEDNKPSRYTFKFKLE